MENADIIHLASYGSKDGICLYSKTNAREKLSMGEVQDLSLQKAKMVILSACDTSRESYVQMEWLVLHELVL